MSKPGPSESRFATLAGIEKAGLDMARCAADAALAEAPGRVASAESIQAFMMYAKAIHSMVKLELDLAAHAKRRAAQPRPTDIRHLH